MKKFIIVLQYELKEFLHSKSFIRITILLAVIGGAVLFSPRFFGGGNDNSSDSSKEKEASSVMLIYDQTGLLSLKELNSDFPDMQWAAADSIDEIKTKVEAQEAEAGFVVNSLTEYDYYIYNTSHNSSGNEKFEAVLSALMWKEYCDENGLDYEDIVSLQHPTFSVNQEVLGKDSASNYWYSYILVIVVYMLIVFYGQMIATSVTVEKSNRAIEVLVTSTTPNSLLFGKVIAGAVAGLLQVGIVLASLLLSYQANRELWNYSLDMFFNIPSEVLITFAFFGTGGYLFYAFLYGAVGALVSKTEDLSKVSGGLNMIIMAIYFAVLFLVTSGDVDSVLMKVLSILPFSSYTVMFVRMAMGNVAIWELIVSSLVLIISILGAGWIGGRIYRMGTLRYGNPIKIRTALKDMKHAD